MPSLADNWFLYLVVLSMIAFVLVLGVVSVADARHRE